MYRIEINWEDEAALWEPVDETPSLSVARHLRDQLEATNQRYFFDHEFKSTYRIIDTVTMETE